MKKILVVVDMQNDFVSGALKNYMDTEEGKNLPVPHCIENTDGWQIVDELRPYANRGIILNKVTFGSVELGELVRRHCEFGPFEKIEFVGICTDICVLSNVALIKAYLCLSSIPLHKSPSGDIK